MGIKEILAELYGNAPAEKYNKEIEDKLNKFKSLKVHSQKPELDEKDAILITYGDITESGQSRNALQTLNDFIVEYTKDIISAVHILPFFPYSSDYGFSIVDYRQVNPELGDWEDIENFNKNYLIAFDAVFNHISRKSDWFKGFLNGNNKYADWFIEPDVNFDTSKVFRPRALPLFHNYQDKEGIMHRIWTTFSEDQVDLNFKSPELLMELIDVLLLYLEKGARIIRLDAIAFCWKESGTRCLHLPQAHLVVKLFREIVDRVLPGTIILTETNVPHQENISYFGNLDEAHIVYQFPLPPLIAQAILRRNATFLTDWAAELEEPASSCTFLNFTASHDGIGVRPLKGLTPDSELFFLANEALRKGGKVGYKNNPDGSQSPYELNINYYSLLSEPGEKLETSVNKFILSQAIMLIMPGIPGIYFHSLFGSENWKEGLPKNSENRAINREKIPVDKLREELSASGSRRKLIYSKYSELLECRSKCKAFHPESGFEILNVCPQVFAVIRGTRQDKKLLALFNVSAQTLEVPISSQAVSSPLRSILDNEIIDAKQVKLKPFGFKWLITM